MLVRLLIDAASSKENRTLQEHQTLLLQREVLRRLEELLSQLVEAQTRRHTKGGRLIVLTTIRCPDPEGGSRSRFACLNGRFGSAKSTALRQV